MNIDIERTLTAMTGKLLESLGQEVDLIIHFGSTVRGTAREGSDLDVCWIPAHEDSWQSITVELQDTLIDLFAIHWSRLHAMADFSDPNGTILRYHRVLYAKDERTRSRFESLIGKWQERQRPESRKQMLEKAFELFTRCGYHYYQLSRAAQKSLILDAIDAAGTLEQTVGHCLMTVNQQSIDTRKKQDLHALPKLPDKFMELRERLAFSRDCAEMKTLADQLMEATRELLLKEQAEVCRETPDFTSAAGGNNYPETANGLRHAGAEAAAGNIHAVNHDVCQQLRELRAHIGQGLTGRWYHDFNSLSELTPTLSGLSLKDLEESLIALDWPGIEAASLELIIALRKLYLEKNTATNRFPDAQALENWLQQLEL